MMDNYIAAHRALSQRVLVVAVVNDEIKNWAAYIDAVPGISHDREKDEVSRKGEKLPEKIAALIFPWITEKYKWRD